MLISLPRTSAADADVRSDAISSRAVLMTDSPFGGREEQPVHRHCAWRRSHSPLPVLLRVYSLAGSDGHSPRFLHARSEEHTSELQSLMRISYAVFCLKKK